MRAYFLIRYSQMTEKYINNSKTKHLDLRMEQFFVIYSCLSPLAISYIYGSQLLSHLAPPKVYVLKMQAERYALGIVAALYPVDVPRRIRVL